MGEHTEPQRPHWYRGYAEWIVITHPEARELIDVAVIGRLFAKAPIL